LVEPEEKRIAIGQTFLEVQREAVAELNLNPEEWLLAQGTIYPDTIESPLLPYMDV
jgi:GMP synthase (glutamine-hydrolysing)